MNPHTAPDALDKSAGIPANRPLLAVNSTLFPGPSGAIRFVGTGEGLEDLTPFDTDRFVEGFLAP